MTNNQRNSENLELNFYSTKGLRLYVTDALRRHLSSPFQEDSTTYKITSEGLRISLYMLVEKQKFLARKLGLPEEKIYSRRELKNMEETSKLLELDRHQSKQ